MTDRCKRCGGAAIDGYCIVGACIPPEPSLPDKEDAGRWEPCVHCGLVLRVVPGLELRRCTSPEALACITAESLAPPAPSLPPSSQQEAGDGLLQTAMDLCVKGDNCGTKECIVGRPCQFADEIFDVLLNERQRRHAPTESPTIQAGEWKALYLEARDEMVSLARELRIALAKLEAPDD